MGTSGRLNIYLRHAIGTLLGGRSGRFLLLLLQHLVLSGIHGLDDAEDHQRNQQKINYSGKECAVVQCRRIVAHAEGHGHAGNIKAALRAAIPAAWAGSDTDQGWPARRIRFSRSASADST